MKIPLSAVEASNPNPTSTGDLHLPQPAPISQADTQQSVLARCSKEMRPRPLRILLVEDEPAVRAVYVEYLQGESFEVETASEGVEALEKFLYGHFDVVVSDRSMPKLCGDDLTAIIKTLQPSKPVILMGALSADGCGPRVPCGANYTLGKPFSLADLRHAIELVTTHQPSHSEVRP